MDSLLYIGAFLHIGLALFHVSFWKVFAWDRQLTKLNPVNKGAMQAMNLALILLFFFFAFISIFFQSELLSSNLGMVLLGFISFFWLVRFFAQYAFFKVEGVYTYIFLITCLALFIIYGFVAFHLINTL